VLQVIFIGICVGIILRQGYNTANKYIQSPKSIHVLEKSLKGFHFGMVSELSFCFDDFIFEVFFLIGVVLIIRANIQKVYHKITQISKQFIITKFCTLCGSIILQS